MKMASVHRIKWDVSSIDIQTKVFIEIYAQHLDLHDKEEFIVVTQD